MNHCFHNPPQLSTSLVSAIRFTPSSSPPSTSTTTTAHTPQTPLPPPQIIIKSQLPRLRVKRRRHLAQPRLDDRVPQVNGRADVLVDLEVARDEREGGHVVAGAPGGRVGFAAVEVVCYCREGEEGGLC